MKQLSLTFLAIVLLLSAIVILRAATMTSRQLNVPPAPPMSLDPNALALRLAEAIKIKTISFQAPRESSTKEFERFDDFLVESFPRVHAQLTKEIVNKFSRLFTWYGKNRELKPVLLMAHLDVVPVDPAGEALWTHPPFSGQLADGFIWGRGSMDDKSSLMAILEAVEYSLQTGFTPKRTLYLAFGHDEEIGGAQGAAKIAELLASRRVELEFVLDEGMNILSGVIDGITAPVALIGIAEKGYLSLQLSANSSGGHSSVPPADMAIGTLSRALQKLTTAPFPAKLQGPTRHMFEFLGAEMGWSKRIALANLWLFEPWVKKQLAGAPLTNAILRTTLAPTLFNAGVKENVLPDHASAVVNLRVMPGETTTGAIDHVRRIVNDPRVQLTPLPIRMEPSAVSDIESPTFRLLQRTIREIAPAAIAAPALLVAATDSRHYAGLTRNIFRFLPITLTAADTRRYHGIDERISMQDYERCVNFYARLIRNLNW